MHREGELDGGVAGLDEGQDAFHLRVLQVTLCILLRLDTFCSFLSLLIDEVSSSTNE